MKQSCLRFEGAERGESALEAWRRHIEPIFTADAAKSDVSAADVAMTTYNTGSLLIGTLRAPPQRLTRSMAKIGQQGIDSFLLQFFTTGSGDIQAGRRADKVGAGRVAVFDLSQPVIVEASAVEAMNIVLPRKLLVDQIDRLENYHGCSLDIPSDPAKSLLSKVMADYISCLHEMPPSQVQQFAGAIVLMCQASFERRISTETARDFVKKLEIRDYIENSMSCQTIDVPSLCSRFGLSRRTLYRLFEIEGGVMAFIMERRLLKAMRLLTRPRPARRPSISSVAFDCGFVDLSTFSRTFKKRFGISPRHAMPGVVLPRNGSGVPTLLSWLLELGA